MQVGCHFWPISDRSDTELLLYIDYFILQRYWYTGCSRKNVHIFYAPQFCSHTSQELYGFQQNVQREIAYMTKASVRIWQLSIFCLQLASELLENKINSKIFKANL